MAYAPVLTQATTLTYNAVLVSGVVSMKGMGSAKSAEIDVTTLASTAKEFRPGLQDFGTITVTLVRSLDDLGQAGLLTAHAAQTTNTCIIVLPSGTLKTATFQASVVELTSDIDKDGVVTGEAILRTTSTIVWS